MREIINPSTVGTVTDVSFSYPSHGTRTVKVSNNLSVLDIGSGSASNDVEHVRIGRNVKSIGDGCFDGFVNLISVDSGDIDLVGDHAFRGCEKLRECSLLEGDVLVGHVGSESFSGADISSAVINAYRDSTLENYSDYALANITHLQSVQFLGQNPDGKGILSGCSNLTSVKFSDTQVCIGKDMFRDCTRLCAVSNISQLAKIGENAFRGCTDLTDMSIVNSKLGSYHCVGDNALYGTKLTEMTLPETITNINDIGNSAFNGMDNVLAVTFSGIDMNSFLQQNGVVEQVSIPENTWLVDVSSSSPDIARNRVLVTDEQVSLLNMYAETKRMPLVILYLDESTSIRSRTIVNRLKQSHQLDKIPSQCGKRAIFYISAGNPLAKGMILDAIDNRMCRTPVLVGRMKSGDTVITRVYDQIENVQSIIDKISEWMTRSDAFGSYTAPLQVTPTITTDIRDTRCFGLGRNQTIYFKDKYVEYDDTLREYTISSVPQIDHITTGDFRYSQWYDKVKPVYDYAYSLNIPVLTLFADSNTTAGKRVFLELFKNKDFQTHVLDKKIILCFVYSEKYDDSYRYCTNSILKFRSDQFLNLTLNQAKGTSWDGAHFTPILRSRSASYKQNDSRFDAVLNNVNQVTEWIDSILGDFDFEEKTSLLKPEVHTFTDPAYDVYENQSDDSYGRYYPSHVIEPPKEGYSYEISVIDGTETKKYTLRDGQTVLPPRGTYRYYTMPRYDSRYVCDHDLSGIIFKVGNSRGTAEVQQVDYEYGSVSYEKYLTDNGIADENISRQLSSVLDEVYQKDDDGNISKNIVDGYDWGDEPVHNSTKTLYVNGITCETETGAKQVDVIELMLSGDVETHSIFDDNPVELTGTQYVVRSEMKRYIDSSNSLESLSVFYNLW